MAKPRDILSYAPEWEAFSKTLLTTTGFLNLEERFTRREALDIRQTFYGYRRALKLATKDAQASDARRQEYSMLYTATMAFQVHVSPNPNDKRNDLEIRFVQQAHTQPIKKFFQALRASPEEPSPKPTGVSPEPESSPKSESHAGSAQSGVDAYLKSTTPKDP